MTRNRQNWRTGGNTFLSSPANQCDTARNIRLMSYTVLTRSDVKLAFVFSRSALEKKNLLLFLSLPFFFSSNTTILIGNTTSKTTKTASKLINQGAGLGRVKGVQMKKWCVCFTVPVYDV